MPLATSFRTICVFFSSARKSSLSLFPPLHGLHKTHRFSLVVLPPFATGMMWSTSRRTPSSAVRPQRRQRWPSRRMMSNRSPHGMLGRYAGASLWLLARRLFAHVSCRHLRHILRDDNAPRPQFQHRHVASWACVEQSQVRLPPVRRRGSLNLQRPADVKAATLPACRPILKPSLACLVGSGVVLLSILAENGWRDEVVAACQEADEGEELDQKRCLLKFFVLIDQVV